MPSSRFQALALAFNFVSTLATVMANKYALKVFNYPATLTVLHYMATFVAVRSMRVAGLFSARGVAATERRTFVALVIAWAVCNALSNASLGANSVGFYQLVKVLTTPIIACIDTVLGKPMTTAQALALGFACCGIAFATVSDVQCNLRGSLLALASVLTGIVQKVLNEHMQQRSGFSTLQLMDGTRGQTGPRASATAHARAPSLLSCVATATHLAAVRPLRCARRQGDAVAFPPMMVPIPKPGPDPGPDPDPGPNPHPA